MSGETNLTALIASMEPVLHGPVYVFVTCPTAEIPKRLPFVLRYEEQEGTTLIVTQADAERFGLQGAFACRCITLNIHSALEAVGFMARIATALAAEGMGVNPVAGYYHDHLYVPADRADDAMRILRQLSKQTDRQV